jgi:hypothetical protein
MVKEAPKGTVRIIKKSGGERRLLGAKAQIAPDIYRAGGHMPGAMEAAGPYPGSVFLTTPITPACRRHERRPRTLDSLPTADPVIPGPAVRRRTAT